MAYAVQVVIEGRGFVATGNMVTFGDVEVPDLPSSDDGKRITFWVPKEVPSTGEVPPMVLEAGDYPVTVTTPSGTSAPTVFVLTRG
jgi:hypothetical protein